MYPGSTRKRIPTRKRDLHSLLGGKPSTGASGTILPADREVYRMPIDYEDRGITEKAKHIFEKKISAPVSEGVDRLKAALSGKKYMSPIKGYGMARGQETPKGLSMKKALGIGALGVGAYAITDHMLDT